jgi:MscS family membrane protein
VAQIEWFQDQLPNVWKDSYLKVIQPMLGWLAAVLGMAALELTMLELSGEGDRLQVLEIPISLLLTVIASWAASQLFKRIFDAYILEAAIRSGRKFSSELLILVKLLVNIAIILTAILWFAQSHQINILGIIASLGIGGLAVAFAAQKTLEQILGGIVLYVDRPFVVDDYIGLPDGTFGKVESIGLRSTKIRTSGKGTLVIVPNSSLTQINIENFSGAKKVMSILNLTLHKRVNSEETALIRRVILDSTNDIFGIDSRNTEVSFVSSPNKGNTSETQVQITFFILGSGEVSMDLRRQLLDRATQNITEQLQTYGVDFTLKEPTLYIDAPITI